MSQKTSSVYALPAHKWSPDTNNCYYFSWKHSHFSVTCEFQTLFKKTRFEKHCDTSLCVIALINLTAWSFDVTDNTYADQWWGLDDGDSLNNLFLVDLGAGSLSLTNNVGHTGLEAQKAGQMDWLGGVILGESLYLTTVACCTFLGVEPHGPVTGCRKLTMRLEMKKKA